MIGRIHRHWSTARSVALAILLLVQSMMAMLPLPDAAMAMELLADGTIDQRRTPRAIKCHACNRNLPADGRDCIYCGAPPVMSSPFSKAW